MSLEIQDEAGVWFEYVSALILGAVTGGQEVKAEIGEASTGHILPNTPTGFRAKLVVENAITIGITVVRVA